MCCEKSKSASHSKINLPWQYVFVLSMGDLICDAPHLTTSDNKLGGVVLMSIIPKCVKWV